MEKNISNLMPWFLVAVNTTALFYLSSQPAEQSKELSSKITNTIVQVIGEVYPDYQNSLSFEQTHRQVRKGAHFVLYLMLGYLVANAKRKEGDDKIVHSILICALIAMLDEAYQITIPGRSGELTDVFIDTLGASTGVGLSQITNSEKEKILTKERLHNFSIRKNNFG